MIREVQLGKNGVTQNFIETLKMHFNKCRFVKVHLLKSAQEERSNKEEIAKEIVKKLGKEYSFKIIGFKIILKKQGKFAIDLSSENK